MEECIIRRSVCLSQKTLMKKIFVVSGPSGAGKSTLINMILKENNDIATVVSHTTRNKRPTEKDGIDYYFISKQRFQDMIKNEQFVEYVECFGNYYGTSIISIKESLEKHSFCIMDLEWDGAFNILNNQKITEIQLTGILILPPSIKAMKDRLKSRGTETPESLERRVHESFIVDKIAKYDHVIINNNLEDAYKELQGIIDHGN